MVAALVDKAAGVEHEDIPALHAEFHVEAGAGDAGGTGAHNHDFEFIDLFAGDLAGVEQGGAGNDGCAVLVVVEDRDIHLLLEFFLNIEAFGRLDVFEVDAAEGGLEAFHDFDDFIGILGSQIDIVDIDVGEALEKDALAFHDGLTGQSADIAKAEHGRAVADDGHEVVAAGVDGGSLRIPGDFQAGLGNARGIGHRQILLIPERFNRNDLEFAGARIAMVIQCFLSGEKRHDDTSLLFWVISYIRKQSRYMKLPILIHFLRPVSTAPRKIVFLSAGRRRQYLVITLLFRGKK